MDRWIKKTEQGIDRSISVRYNNGGPDTSVGAAFYLSSVTFAKYRYLLYFTCMYLRFSKFYFVLTFLLFLIEVLIALYVHDSFIRPYVGDFLVVVLLYCFACSFVKAPVVPMALAVLLFSYLIETLQYFNVVQWLGLGNSRLANVIIGNYFTWSDIIAYTLGIGFTILVEKLRLVRFNAAR
jgi:hypothetical protein